MKIDLKHSKEEENLFVDESDDFSFNKEAMNLLMSLFTNLYKNPSHAVAREVVSNAIDSTLQRKKLDGFFKPVEVTLPNFKGNNFFAVKDSGLGLNKQDIKKFFIEYGGSTKRKDNIAMGGYGLGAKSPLAIAETFAIISIKDGIKIYATVKRSEHASTPPKILWNLEEKTDEPNGVEIRIPIADSETFISGTKSFFYGVDDKLVLVNGQKIEDNINSSKDWKKLGKFGYINVNKTVEAYNVKNLYNKHLNIIIGSVIYNIDQNSENTDELLNKYGIYNIYNNSVVRVPIGEIDLTPSRDEIRFTEKTVTGLMKVYDKFHNTLLKETPKMFDLIEKPEDALIFYYKILKTLDVNKNVWKGIEIPNTNVIEKSRFNIYITRSDSPEIEKLPTVSLLDVVNFVKKGDAINVPIANDKQMKYLTKDVVSVRKSDRKNNEPLIVFVEKPAEEPVAEKAEASSETDTENAFKHDIWLEKIVPVRDYETLRQEALAYRRKVRNAQTQKDETSYPVLTAKQYRYIEHFKASEIDENIPYVVEGESPILDKFFKANKSRRYSTYSYVSDFQKFLEYFQLDDKIVYLPKRFSLKVFKQKTDGKLVHLKKRIEETLPNIVNQITEKELQEAVVFQQVKSSDLGTLYNIELIRPFLPEIVSPATRQLCENILNLKDLTSSFNKIIFFTKIEPGLNQRFIAACEKAQETQKYPLLRNASIRDMEHVVAYLNFVERMN